MQAKLLATLIAILLETFDGPTLKRFVDFLLDWVENAVVGSASQVDDKLVLPIIGHIRKVFDIPDNDEPEPAE